MKQSDKHIAKIAFEAGIKAAWSEQFPYDSFEKWFSNNSIPKEVEEAGDLINKCESDPGFMGSTEYDEAKKIIDKHFKK